MMYIECDVFHFHGMYLNGIYGNKINQFEIFYLVSLTVWYGILFQMNTVGKHLPSQKLLFKNTSITAQLPFV